MIKVTLDTNVLVSGTFWTGESFKILEAVNNKEVINVTSNEIIEEFKEICFREEILDKTNKTIFSISRSIEKIASISVIVFPSEHFNVIEDDDDNKVIDAAVEGRVDYIVTYDKSPFDTKRV